MNGRQLRVALSVATPEDFPPWFPIGHGRTVTVRVAFLEGLHTDAEAGRRGWEGDLRAALDHLEDPAGFRRRYADAGGAFPSDPTTD